MGFKYPLITWFILPASAVVIRDGESGENWGLATGLLALVPPPPFQSGNFASPSLHDANEKQNPFTC